MAKTWGLSAGLASTLESWVIVEGDGAKKQTLCWICLLVPPGLMVDGIGGDDGAAALVCAWLARLAIFVMLIYFTALDAICGIGLGRTVLVVQGLVADGKLSPQQFDGIVLLLDSLWTDPWIGGVASFVSETASWAAFAASVFIAAADRLTRPFVRRRQPRPAAVAARLSHAAR